MNNKMLSLIAVALLLATSTGAYHLGRQSYWKTYNLGHQDGYGQAIEDVNDNSVYPEEMGMTMEEYARTEDK